MINDVCALREEGALETAVDLQQAVCLMHMQGRPQTMQQNPQYVDVVADVTQFLRDRVAQCRQAGLHEDLIVLDPGFGFGKMPADNVELLANLRQLLDIGPAILIGLSRKSTLGVITGRDVDALMPAGLAAAVMAVERGALIVRTHDVGATVDALRVARVVMESDQDE